MDFYDVLRSAALSSDVPLTHIGPALGKSSAYVNNAISRGSDPSTANAAAMLNVCGYSLCVLPSDDVPPGAVTIDPAS